jgi:hypothetical protein
MMSMGLTNGRGSVALEDEWESPGAAFANPYAQESEDELTGEAGGFETAFEDEWESPGAAFANPYAQESEDELTGEAGGFETAFEDEMAGESGGFESVFETPEWTGEAAGFETAFETPEWTGEAASHEVTFEDEGESDQFLPFLAPLALKALPMVAKFALPAVKKLLPVAKQAIGRVVRNVTSTPVPPQLRPTVRTFMRGLGAQMPGPTPRRRYAYRPYPRPLPFMPQLAPGGDAGPGPSGSPFPQPTPQPPMSLGTILRGLSQVLNLGDAVAQEAEASLFGANELQAELANHETAHEAALTEVLAAEAAHATTEAEAEALLGSALPITIRVMSGSRATRSLTPTLTRANARLVSSLRRSGPGGPQLLRAVPAIQRRTIATIREARRNGRPIGHRMVGPIMAAQAARVLGSPHTCGRTLVRNVAIRQGTVAPAGRIVRQVR